jgi:hypothetical protein
MKYTGLIVGLLVLGAAATARAEVAAVWAEGQGGVGNAGAQPGGAPALGFRLGARLLIFEGYLDRSDFGSGVAATRGIVGLRAGFGSDDTRLVLRAGGGVLHEDGGAVTGRTPGMPDRSGPVARAGAAIETRVAPAFLLGLGLDAETFWLPAAGSPSLVGARNDVVGSDVFMNLHLTFELGI